MCMKLFSEQFVRRWQTQALTPAVPCDFLRPRIKDTLLATGR